MLGKTNPACALQPDVLIRITFLTKSRYLPAQPLLVTFPKPYMIMIENITANIVSHPHGAHIPSSVHLQKKVPGKMHYRKFGHKMKERLVPVFDYDVVCKSAIMPESFRHIGSKF